MFTGFYPAVSGRWRGEADYPAPLILRIHVFTFAAWLCRLTTQVLLIRARQPASHRKVSAMGAVLIPVLVITGVGAEAYSQRFCSPHIPAGDDAFVHRRRNRGRYGSARTRALTSG